jgi:hypothetical protein
MTVKIKESLIQKEIILWLELHGYTFWRNFVGPKLMHGKYFAKNPMAGLPDILGIFKKIPGKLFGLEIKSDLGKLSDDQVTWIRKLENSGVSILVTRDLETVIAWMRIHDNDDTNRPD